MGFRAHPGVRRRAALASSTSRLLAVTYRRTGLRRSREVPRGVFCSADFIKNGELQRILAARVDVGRENSQWWTLATRGAGQIRALFCEVFTRLRIRLGHFKLPARPSTFLQSDFSLNRAEIERTRGHLYAHGICLDPSTSNFDKKDRFLLRIVLYL